MNSQIDVRDVLPAISAPTLVLYRRDARFGHGAAAWRQAGEDPITPRGEAEYLAEHVPGARLVELPGAPPAGSANPTRCWASSFTGSARAGEDRVLATILFTDITVRPRWPRDSRLASGRPPERHNAPAVSSSGSAARSSTPPGRLRRPFDLRAASAAPGDAEPVSASASIRAGIHTGEAELVDASSPGTRSTSPPARVPAEADEVLVSNTVTTWDGSRMTFADRGARAEGRARRVSLFAVDAASVT
jgi:hypothetical protein